MKTFKQILEVAKIINRTISIQFEISDDVSTNDIKELISNTISGLPIDEEGGPGGRIKIKKIKVK